MHEIVGALLQPPRVGPRGVRDDRCSSIRYREVQGRSSGLFRSGVCRILKRNDATGSGRVPPHVSAESGVATGMKDRTSPVTILLHEEAKAVTVAAAGLSTAGDGPLDLLHLPPTRSGERARLGTVWL